MSSTKNEVLEELKGLTLTTVIGRKPTAQDVDRWEDEVAEMAALIKTSSIPGGETHGLLAVVIPEEEYQLEIEDEEFEYEEPTDPGAYPDLEGTEDEAEIKRLEAEHKQKKIDYLKYTGLTEHVRRQFTQCMDKTWIQPLKKGRIKYAGVTIKQFFTHLRSGVAKLSTKEEEEMKDRVFIEWNQTEDIAQYFKNVEEAQYQAEKWECKVDQQQLVNHAVIQMLDSNIFEPKFLRDWEVKPKGEKSWNNMKQYFTDEYRLITQYEKNKKKFGSINNIQEKETDNKEITEFFEEFRRDAMVGTEQINQMAQAFTGAADASKELADRLKTAMATIETQNKTIATLTNTNKQLTDNNTKLAEALKKAGGGGGGYRPRYQQQNQNQEGKKCHICGNAHKEPFEDECWVLKKNKNKVPAHYKPPYEG